MKISLIYGLLYGYTKNVVFCLIAHVGSVSRRQLCSGFCGGSEWLENECENLRCRPSVAQVNEPKQIYLHCRARNYTKTFSAVMAAKLMIVFVLTSVMIILYYSVIRIGFSLIKCFAF